MSKTPTQDHPPASPIPPKQSKFQQSPQTHSNISQFPTCMNKQQAKLVCLNPKCQDYAFFCTNCQNDECEVVHHHGNKLLSVSFKEYIKKVLKERPIDEDLQQALNKYAECLQKLKKDVEQFVEKELNELQQIKRKSQQMGQQQERIKRKLRKKQYDGLKGSQLDFLWQKVGQFDKRDKNKQAIEFLQTKQEQIKQISENFQKVNTMELEEYAQEINEEQPTKKTTTKESKDKKDKEKEQRTEKIQTKQTNNANNTNTNKPNKK